MPSGFPANASIPASPGVPRPSVRPSGRGAIALAACVATLATAGMARAQSTVAPWTRTVPAFAEAQRQARAGRPDAAVALLDGLRDGGPDADVPPPPALDYAAGRILDEAGRPDEALARYRAAAASPLADAALFRSGRLRLARGDVAGARADLGAVSPASDAFVPARLLLADSLVREGRFAAARVVADDLLQDDLSGTALFGARMARVAALAASGATARAASEAFLAWLHAPGRREAADASSTLAALGAAPTPAHATLRDLVQAHGRALEAMARQARRGSKRLARQDPGLPALIQGVAARSARRTRERAVTLLEQAVERAADARVRGYAMLSLGRALVAVDRDEDALARFLALRDAEPDGPFAAGAIFDASRCATRLGDTRQATALLERLAREHPEGGLLARVRWELVLSELVAGRDAAALDRLDAALVRLDRGDGVAFGAVERLRYFRGVVLERLGRPVEARADLERVARGDPWSYYGVLAAGRLGRGDAGRTVRPDPAVGRWPGPLPDTRPSQDALSAADVAASGAAGPVWLWRLGFVDEARAQLAARARLGLLDEAGTRLRARMDALGRGPAGAMAAHDAIRGAYDPDDPAPFVAAHPRPYADAVEAAARETGVDPALVYAVMRVESRFQSRARSPAGAVGLMQVLRSTARRVASVALGDRRIASRVARPAQNVRIGAALLGALDGHFRGHLPLVLVGYHAGSGAARRFHRVFGHLPTDVFVEVLPYAQTTRYIRRVIGLAAAYRALYDDGTRGPVRVAPALPDGLGPFLERPAGVPGA
jgi:soluble lytic murein transglycosylase